MFNILGDIEGMSVLDLFAGTGAMGLEALSRGATHATFVEIDRQALAVVQRNIDATISGADRTTDVIKGDASRIVQTLAMAGERYDLVFFDPPYERTEEMIRATAHTLPAVCMEGTRVVLELSNRHDHLIEGTTAVWGGETVLTRTYGDTAVAILKITPRNDDSVVPEDPDDSEVDDAGDEADGDDSDGGDQ